MSAALVSYPSIFTLGHAAIADLFDGPVVVQEKVDGSQFSFGVRDGVLFCRSKGAELVVQEPEKMFTQAVSVASGLAECGALVEGWTYRAEYLRSPRHNTLTYDRVPAGHLVLFDVDSGTDKYEPPGTVASIAELLRLEPVATLYEGVVTDFDALKALLDQPSALGCVKVEGIVVKNYARFGRDKRPLMGKYVSEAFKEKNREAWKVANPGGKDIIERIVQTYRTEARWQKAVQHLREAGKLEGSPRDIALLIREVPSDVFEEYGEEIARALHDWARHKIERGLRAGLAEWYKERLAREAFAPEESAA